MSSPPWRDVIVKSRYRFNISDAGAMKLSPCMPGLGQGSYDTGCLILPALARPARNKMMWLYYFGTVGYRIQLFKARSGPGDRYHKRSLAIQRFFIRHPRPPRLPRPVPGRDGEGEADGGQAASNIQYRETSSLDGLPVSRFGGIRAGKAELR